MYFLLKNGDFPASYVSLIIGYLYFNVFFPMFFCGTKNQDFRQSLEVAALKDEVGLLRYRGLGFEFRRIFPTQN